MKLHLLPLALLSAIALSACSGSSSNSNPAEDPKNSPDKTIEKTADKNAEKTADKTTEKTADKTVEKTADKNAEKTADKTTEKTADKTVEKTTEKSAEKTTDKTADKPDNNKNESNKPVVVSTDNVTFIKGNAAPKREKGELAEGEWSTVTINGKKMLLNIDGNAQPSSAGSISFQYFPQLGHKAIYHLTDGSKDFRYGHIYSSQDPNDFDYFVAGALAPESALKGSAVYNGNAFLQSSKQKALANFKADVNFDQKTVAGSFSNLRPYMFYPGPPAKLDSFKEVVSAQDFAGKSELGFSATIKGNQFEGNGAVGNFYGDKAQSIGGVIKDEKYTGAFGGSR